MGIDRNTYTVQLRRTIRGVILLSYRRRGRYKQTNIQMVPYALASYLNLVPTGTWGFTNRLYNFEHSDLSDLDVGGPITRVTRTRASVFVTIDLSLV